jgi:bifunctional oligoribonuclease and PAP phosphatase NrnA
MYHLEDLIAKIRHQLKTIRSVLIVSHLRPDGDAIGSLLGIGLALQEAGKEVQMVLSDGVPENFQHLVGSERVKNYAEGEFDYIIVVDSSDVERTDTALAGYPIPDLNIDHHKTNTNFAKINLVESGAVATAEILARYLPNFGLTLTQAVANALLTGILTDTIGFRTSNVNSSVLRLAADLMDLGGNIADIYYPALVEHSLAAARYWGAGLSKIQYENGLVWTNLTLNDRDVAGYPDGDDADLVNVLSAIKGADIAIILVEQSSGYVKISWRLCGRSSTDLDVSEIAQKYGGGGHKAAAGAEVLGKLDEILSKVIDDTRALINHVNI